MAKDFELTFGVVGQAVAITGLESLINLTKQLTDKIKEQARSVSEYTSVVNGHTVSVRAADEATAGLVDTVELHRTAARLESAGLAVTSEQLRGLAVAGAQFAQRTGIPVTEAFQRMTTSTISADEGLRQFGITIAAGGTIAQRQNRVLEALEARYGTLSVSVRNTDEAVSQLSNTWGTAWTEMLADLERSAGPIRTIIGGLTEKLQEMVNALETARNAAQNRAARAAADPAAANQRRLDALRRRMAARGEGGLQQRATGASRIGDAFMNFTPQGLAIGAVQRGLALRPQEARRIRRQRERDEAELNRLVRVINRQRRETAAANTPEARLAGAEFVGAATTFGGGAQATDAETTPERTPATGGGGRASRTAREQREAQEERERLLDNQRETAEAQLKERQSEMDREREQDERRMEERQHFADVASDLRQKELEEERAAEDERKNMLERAAQQERRLAEEREERLQSLTSVVTASTSLINDIAAVAVAAAGDNARAQKVVNGIIGTATIAREGVAAVVEVARAASDVANNQYGSAALHVIAAAAHVAAGAKAAAELGGKKSGGSTGGAGSGGAVNRPEFTGGGSQQTSDNTNVTFVNHGPVTSREVQDDLRQAALNSSRRAA